VARPFCIFRHTLSTMQAFIRVTLASVTLPSFPKSTCCLQKTASCV
jgi:hypothetical protein